VVIVVIIDVGNIDYIFGEREIFWVLSNKWYVLSRTKLLECCVLVDRFIILRARRESIFLLDCLMIKLLLGK